MPLSPLGPITYLIAFPHNNSSSQLFLTNSFIYIYSLLQGFSTTKIVDILKHSQFKNFHLQFTSLFGHSLPNFNTYNNGFSFTWYQKGIIFCKPSIFESSGCGKGLPCSLCRRENEAVCDPHIILEQTVIPGLAKSGWGRVWISPSQRWPHNSLQWRCLPTYNFFLELINATLGDWHRLAKTFCTIGVFSTCKDLPFLTKREKKDYRMTKVSISYFFCVMTMNSTTQSNSSVFSIIYFTMFTSPCMTDKHLYHNYTIPKYFMHLDFEISDPNSQFTFNKQK